MVWQFHQQTTTFESNEHASQPNFTSESSGGTARLEGFMSCVGLSVLSGHVIARKCHGMTARSLHNMVTSTATFTQVTADLNRRSSIATAPSRAWSSKRRWTCPLDKRHGLGLTWIGPMLQTDAAMRTWDPAYCDDSHSRLVRRHPCGGHTFGMRANGMTWTGGVRGCPLGSTYSATPAVRAGSMMFGDPALSATGCADTSVLADQPNAETASGLFGSANSLWLGSSRAALARARGIPISMMSGSLLEARHMV